MGLFSRRFEAFPKNKKQTVDWDIPSQKRDGGCKLVRRFWYGQIYKKTTSLASHNSQVSQILVESVHSKRGGDASLECGHLS